VVRDLGWTFTRPYTRVLDVSRGIAWPQWFPGGETNLTANCVDRNIAAGRGGETAVIWESEQAEVRTLTYAALGRR
jgi:acetyl-CoA synthetase